MERKAKNQQTVTIAQKFRTNICKNTKHGKSKPNSDNNIKTNIVSMRGMRNKGYEK